MLQFLTKKRKKGAGFTLIELLVVIAIIGILGGIVFVGMEGHVERARITRSISFSHSIERTIGHYLVGRWSFDKGTGTTTYDRSPFGNHGTIYGVPVGENPFSSDTPHDLIGHGAGRYSLSFDGANDFVDAGNDASLDITDAITMEVWVKPNAQNVNDYILSKYVDAANCSYGMGITDEAGKKIKYFIYTSAGIYAATPLYTVTLGEWHHYVVTYDGANVKSFVNNVEILSEPLTGNIVISTANVEIGRLFSGLNFNGLIDEVRIYNKAL